MNEQLENKTHTLAIKYKYEGKKYKNIIQIIKNVTGETVTSQMLRNWFMTGGKLFNSYIQYADKQNDMLIKEGQQELKGLVKKAIQVVKDTMHEFISVKLQCPKCGEEYYDKIEIPTKYKLSASKEVLDRVLGVMENTTVNNYNIYNNLTINDIDRRIKEAEGNIEAFEGSKINETGGEGGKEIGT